MPDDIIMNSLEKLEQLAAIIDTDERFEQLKPIEEATKEFHKSWSGSWLGYHSRNYLEGFRAAMSGQVFSHEWGKMDTWGGDTTGPWVEYAPEVVRDELIRRVGSLDVVESLLREAEKAQAVFDDEQFRVITRLEKLTKGSAVSSSLDNLMEKIKELKGVQASGYITIWRPSEQATRDMTALQEGFITPEHLKVLAEIYAIRHPFLSARELAKLTRRALSFFDVEEQIPEVKPVGNQVLGSRVFIGHGRSLQWRVLKDFLQDSLGLDWEEFNRIATAGYATTERLGEMMDNANFAFLVMTGEDETADGDIQPRLNVVHEAGLLQGRLGFKKAIILLEDGCAEFSNIVGLTQIRFPRGDVAAKFEEIRRVLEREGVI